MSQHKILIVTPFFAPQSHAAVFRAYKLAKYLPQYGWKPYVVTTDVNYSYNEDPQLLIDLPREVEVHRVRYIEPTLRGVRMALGGVDRTFKSLKAKQADASIRVTQPVLERVAFNAPSRLYQAFNAHYLRKPDTYWTWERPAIRIAKTLLRRHQISLVFTSADPYTCHRIGYRLQGHGVRWIADLRDPHTHSALMHSHLDHVYNRQRQAERTAVERADALTVAAESIALILSERYALLEQPPVHFIPTGMDTSLLEPPQSWQSPPFPYFVFSGEFLPYYDKTFFRLFAKALTHPAVAATGIKCLFIGRQDVNRPRLLPLIQQFGLGDSVELIDHVPQRVLYQYLKASQAALLISGHRQRWWCLYAKQIDYLALRKPVIAVVPNPSEARTHLQGSGLGIFLDGDEDVCVQRLIDFVLRDKSNLEVNDDYCEQFTAKAQVSAFVDIFEEVLGIDHA